MNFKWYFSVDDVVQILTGSANVKDYIKKLRKRDPELDAYWGINCPLVAMPGADGKIRPIRAAHAEGPFRIIQSIPSPKAPLVRTLPVAGDIARRTAAAMLFPIASHDYRMIEKAILKRDLTDDLATAAASRSLSNAISSLP